jgi:uncharacterized protein (DUF2249 family)
MATEKESTMAADAATANPIDAIAAHHDEMEEELRRRVNDLVAVVSRGEPSDPAVMAVIDYLQTTILPHAASEEATLYAATARFEPRLIESLVAEHRALGDLISELAEVGEPVSSVATAGAIAALFAIHAAKENDFVLPALIEGAPGEVPGVLASMHAEFERQVGPGGATLHVRGIPHGARHAQIFSRLEALASGEALVIVSDHDPVRLRGQLLAEHPGVFEWEALEHGPEVWRVRIGRSAAGSASPSP